MTRLNCLRPWYLVRQVTTALTLVLLVSVRASSPFRPCRRRRPGRPQQGHGAETRCPNFGRFHGGDPALRKRFEEGPRQGQYDLCQRPDGLSPGATRQPGGEQGLPRCPGGRRPGGDRRGLENLSQRGPGRSGKRREAQPQAAAGPIRNRQAQSPARRRFAQGDGSPRQDDRAGRRRRR